MTNSITLRLLGILMALMLAFGVALTPALVAYGEEEADTSHAVTAEDDDMDDDHDHDAHDHETDNMGDASRIEQLQTLLTLLVQLVDLLEHQLEHQAAAASALSISVEEHGGDTHIHVYENSVQTDAFFLAHLELDQRSEIIAAIAERTGHSEAEVEAAATFPAIDANDDHAHDEHEDDAMDLDGIHIMADGSVMLGDGTVLDDATVTDDDMIMLADGTLVEPEMDLR